MPKPLSRSATSWPMRPKPTMPTFFSSSSTPPYLLRFQAPSLRASLAGAMLRAQASSRPTASSAALVMLEVGAFTTMTPALVAVSTSTLSRPDAGAGDDLEVLGGGDGLGVHLRGGADEDRVDVGEGREQGAAVGAVDVADLEVRAEGVERRG